MHCFKLTPLQSRFAASFLASVLLVLLYFLLSNPSFAYAIDVDSIHSHDHNHPLTFDAIREAIEGDNFDDDLYADDDFIYEPEFQGVNRGIIGRAASGTTALENNIPQTLNLDLGETTYWVFTAESLAGPKSVATPGLPSDEAALQSEAIGDTAANATTLYLSMTTCLQPSYNGSSSSYVVPPQLKMYVSTEVTKPGPDADGDQQVLTATEGLVTFELESSTSVYVAVSVENNTDYTGIYNFELAGSIDDYYHTYNSATPNLYWVDSGTNDALLVTNNLTQEAANSTVYKEWMNMTEPFHIFASNINQTAIMGVERSYCGLQNYAQFTPTSANVRSGMTTRGLGAKPKQQFYLDGLNATSNYHGMLAMTGNSTASGAGVVGGGGIIWQIMNFTTKTDYNCAIVFNLTFCDQVAYAVPSNPKFSVSELSAIYDSNSAAHYENFNKSLQQIPCNTTSSAQYSLARDCDDCATAYKQWLCAVTIPRCEDFTNNASYLEVRNAGQKFLDGHSLPLNSPYRQNPWTNASRVKLIDTEIEPGPYKEVLPCKDLCWDLQQSCPAALGLTCPEIGYIEKSYGDRSANGDVTCSWLGAAYYLVSGAERQVRFASMGFGAAIVVFWVAWMGVL